MWCVGAGGGSVLHMMIYIDLKVFENISRISSNQLTTQILLIHVESDHFILQYINSSVLKFDIEYNETVWLKSQKTIEPLYHY